MKDKKVFPENMVPLGDEPFTFSCHSEVACYMSCCRNVDMFLFPYDVIRLKNRLDIHSEHFIRKYTRLSQGTNPFFPAVMLKLEETTNACPFLSENGCSVYSDRPSSCRTYPLERAVDRSPSADNQREFYFLTAHSYCLGHDEQKSFTAREWVRNQRLYDFNLMNDLWAEVDTVFATNPWKGEGAGGQKQQLAFMVCYNIDGFRDFLMEKKLVTQYRVDRDWKRRIQKEDTELLKFGFEWLKLMLGAQSSLVSR